MTTKRKNKWTHKSCSAFTKRNERSEGRFKHQVTSNLQSGIDEYRGLQPEIIIGNYPRPNALGVNIQGNSTQHTAPTKKTKNQWGIHWFYTKKFCCMKRTTKLREYKIWGLLSFVIHRLSKATRRRGPPLDNTKLTRFSIIIDEFPSQSVQQNRTQT